MVERVRHVLGLSGGKDSTALAVFMKQKYPEIAKQIEFFFCDTHKELPETYEYLERIKARLGIDIEILQATRGFDHWMEVYGQVLPSPTKRWCTDFMKIKPLEKFIGRSNAISYIAIRADEDRNGYISRRPNIVPVFPFKEHGLVKADIFRLLEESGIGLPKYYEWRSRSGCFFCFYQRKYEWIMLSERHPDLFQRALDYERSAQARGYTWVQGESLTELLARKDEILEKHRITMEKKQLEKDEADKPLATLLEDVLIENEDDIGLPCLMCHS